EQEIRLVEAEHRSDAILSRRIDEVELLRPFEQEPGREMARPRAVEPRREPRCHVRDRLVAQGADGLRGGCGHPRDLRDDDDAPGRVGDHASGPAADTASSTVSSNWAKLSRNIRASSAALRSYASESAQVERGSSSAASTPGTLTGTSKPKT